LSEIKITKDEALILAQALNEICNGPEAIEEWEFHTRIGATREEAENLLERFLEYGQSKPA